MVFSGPQKHSGKTQDEFYAHNRSLRAGVTIASDLEFLNISHSFDDKLVLDDVSFHVEPGEVLSLLGPSGSGKSTLLRIAAGLDIPTHGEIRIDGQVVSGGDKKPVPPEKRNVGLVFQDYALFPHLTILENVKFGLTALQKREAEQQAMHVLSCVDMETYSQKYPFQLSGGEQQRVALARALAPKPGILLMDEPFSGLDSRLRDTVREQTLQLLKETNSTALIVTHDPLEALRVSHHIALMRKGKLVQHGTGEELYKNPTSLFAAAFFSEVNVFERRVENGAVETPMGKLPIKDCADGEAVVVAVRHADLLLKPLDEKAKDQDLKPAIIVDRRYLGTVELVNLVVEGFEQPLKAAIRHSHMDGEIEGRGEGQKHSIEHSNEQNIGHSMGHRMGERVILEVKPENIFVFKANEMV